MNRQKNICKIILNMAWISIISLLFLAGEVSAQITITYICPPSGSRKGGQEVIISGSGFTCDPFPVVKFGITDSKVTECSTDKIKCTTPAYTFEQPVDVVITSNGKSATGKYTFVAPLVINIPEPFELSADSEDRVVTITPSADYTFGTCSNSNGKCDANSNISQCSVKFDDKEAEILSWTEKEIRCNAPLYDDLNGGEVDLVVTSSDWASNTPYTFTYTRGSGKVLITEVSPSAAIISTGNVDITITGNNFRDNSLIKFGEEDVTKSCTVNSLSEIKCSVSSDTAGDVAISVTDGNTDSYTYSGFKYIAEKEVNFEITPQTWEVRESAAGEVTLEIKMKAGSGKEVSVPFTLSGTAVNTKDYDLTDENNQKVISPFGMPANQLTKILKIKVKDDVVCEGDETIQFTITKTIQSISANIAIKDNDICVGEGKPYTTIQAAIDKAADGDTILVGDGIYKENLVIENKPNITLKSENGYESTTIAGMKNASVIDIQKSENVTVDGFTIYAFDESYENYGIRIWWESDNCTIINNRFGDENHENKTGILLLSSNYNKISNNILYSNRVYSIFMQDSDNNIISDNPAVTNGVDITSGSSYNIVSNNNFNPDGYSVSLVSADNNIILNNKNMGMLYIGNSDYNFIYSNSINDYELNGAFYIKFSNYNTFFKNSIKDIKGKRILYIYYSSYNSYYRNTFESSTEFDVEFNKGVVFEVDQANNNLFFLNNIGVKEISYYSTSIWDLPAASYKYKNQDVSSPKRLGNFHIYPSEQYKDTNPQDGIIDISYDFNETTWYNDDGKITDFWGDDNEQLDDYYPLAATPDQYTFPVLWLNSDNTMYNDDKMSELIPGNVTIAPGDSHIWLADKEETAKIYTGVGVGRLIFIEPLTGEFTVEIGTSSDGTSWGKTSRTVTLKADNESIIDFETNDEESFDVKSNEHLAVRITNNTENSYNLLTGGAWSYVSLKESEGGGITSVSPEDGFTAGQTITINGLKFGNSAGKVMFGDKEAGYNISSSTPISSWTDNKIECLAPAYDTGRVLKVITKDNREFTYTLLGFKYKGPWVSFDASPQEVTEGDNAAFTVKKEPKDYSNFDITVNFTVSGENHDLQNDSIIISQTEESETRKFHINDVEEPCEDLGEIKITMVGVTNAVINTEKNTHTITIKNDEICVGENEDIQSAIDNAPDNAYIYVQRTSYEGNIIINNINKPIRLESLVETKINGTDNTEPVFLIQNDNVTIKGFTISGSQREGIRLDGVKNCSISDNILVGDTEKNENSTGIFIYFGSANTISDNTCSNFNNGIYVQFSDTNTISNNTCYSNLSNGIYVQYSDTNTISKNTCNSNLSNGIYIQYSEGNTISNNICKSNSSNGIYVQYSDNNTVESNILTGDINGDQKIDIADAIIVLKMLAGSEVSPLSIQSDVNGDNKIGSEEAIYILQLISMSSVL